MKRIYARMFALLLTLALAFGLAAPAFATFTYNEFAITKQPKAQTVPYGEPIILSVEVRAPDGAKVTYKWYAGSTIDGATEPIFLVSPGDPEYPTSRHPYKSSSFFFSCIVTAVEEDANGNIINKDSRWSTSVLVTVEAQRKPNFFESIYLFFMNIFSWFFALIE